MGPVSCAGQFGFRSAGQLAVWQFLLFVIDIGMLNPSTRDTVVRSVSGHRPNVTKRLGVLTIVVVRLAVEREVRVRVEDESGCAREVARPC